jgi:hypothetical protein
MSTLFQLKIDPFQVIALCPGLLPPSLRPKYTFPVQIDDMSTIIPLLTLQVNHVRLLKGIVEGPALTSALMALSSYLELKRKDLRLSERLLQLQQAYQIVEFILISTLIFSFLHFLCRYASLFVRLSLTKNFMIAFFILRIY